jgi:hypothetical protein
VFSNNTTGGNTNFYDGTQHTITINPLSALPTIADPLTINGPGASVLTITAGGAGRIFTSSSATGTTTVTLSGMTLTGATISGVGGAIDLTTGNLTVSNVNIVNNSATAGAGIYNASTGAITVTNSVISNNTTSGSGGGIDDAGSSAQLITITGSTLANNSAAIYGGGVYLASSDGLLLQQSTVAGNTAQKGGGLYWFSAGAMLIDRSTLSGNVSNYAFASNGGGGLYFFGTPSTVGSVSGLTISNSTIANNTAPNGGGIVLRSFSGTLNVVSTTITGNVANTSGTGAGYGGGGIAINSGSGTIALDNTIVSGNNAAVGTPDIATTATGSVTSTYDAIGNTTGFTYTAGAGDLPVGANLHLLPLANNGGPTQTVAFTAATSPLLDVGDPTTTLTTDQRGFARVFGPAEDIGAYEAQPMTVASVVVNDGSAQRSEVRSITVTFSGPVTFAGGNAAAAAAFQLQHVQNLTNVANLQAAVSLNALNQTVVTLTFTTTGNANTEVDPTSVQFNANPVPGPSLADGRFQLTILSANVSGPDGLALAGGGPGGNYVSPADTLGGGAGQLHLYRLYGDATGNGIVDQLDLGQFRGANNSSLGDSNYLVFLDANNDGHIDQIDLGQFRVRNNSNIFV